MRTWLLRFLTAGFTLAIASGVHAGAPLDIVGIKIGMTPGDAVTAIKAHNPRIKLFVAPEKVYETEVALNKAGSGRAYGTIRKIAFTGVQPFIYQVAAMDQTNIETNLEAFAVSFAPGLSGASEVAVGLRREIRYKQGRELTSASLLAALKEKYGPPTPTNSAFGTFWYYDAAGKPLPEQPAGCPAITNWNEPQAGMNNPELLNYALPCQAWVVAEIRTLQSNQALAHTVIVTIVDARLQATHYKAARAAAIEYARQEKANETNAAAKRGGGKF